MRFTHSVSLRLRNTYLRYPTGRDKVPDSTERQTESGMPSYDSAPELISAKDLTLALQGATQPSHLDDPASFQSGMDRSFHKGHRRNNSAHISSRELPFETVGVHLDSLSVDDKSVASDTVLDDQSPLEEGVDASSLNGFNIDDDPELNPSFTLGSSELFLHDPAVVGNDCSNSFPETDDLKAARKQTAAASPSRSVAPALQPPSSAPVSLVTQEQPQFNVSISPVKSPTIVLPSEEPAN